MYANNKMEINVLQKETAWSSAINTQNINKQTPTLRAAANQARINTIWEVKNVHINVQNI